MLLSPENCPLAARRVLLGIAVWLCAWPAAAQPLSFVTSYQSNPVQDATGIVLSADGRQLYVAGNSQLALLERSASNGSLRFAGALDLGGIQLAGDFIDLALSPDGRHLYVGAGGVFLGDRPALGVFARDPATGELALVERLVHTAFGKRGVNGRVPLVLSRDGRHLYVLGRSKRRLLVYERNPESGALRLIQELAGSGGRFGIHGLAISPEGGLVVVAGEPLLAAFRRDPATGRLIAVGRWDDLSDPSDGLTALEGRAVTFSPDGRHLYALATTQDFLPTDGEVVASFDRHPVTGVPRFLRAPRETQLNSGTDLELSADGEHLYVPTDWGALGGMSTLSVFARDTASGSLRGTQFLIEDSEYTQGNETQCATVSPDGRHLYLGSFDRHPVAVFRRNTATGQVRVAPMQTRGLDSFGGAAAVTTSADGARVYVAARGRLSLSAFERRDGGLSFDGAVFESDPAVDGMFEPGAVVSSRDGRYLYVLGDNAATIAIFAPDGATGKPSFVRSLGFGGNAFDAVVSPDDRHLYVLGEGLFLVSRNADSFSLGALDAGGFFIPFGSSLAISPDGRQVYVVSGSIVGAPGESEIAIYNRNTSDGQLTLSRTITALSPAHPIARGLRLAFDANGQHGYLSALLQDGRAAVLVLSRNTSDGGLSFVEAEVEGSGGVTGLRGSGPLTVAASGAFVYAAGSADDTLVVFSRNTTNGQLQPVQVLSEGEDGVSGVAGLSALAAAADGRLYGVSETQSTLVVLRQNG